MEHDVPKNMNWAMVSVSFNSIWIQPTNTHWSRTLSKALPWAEEVLLTFRQPKLLAKEPKLQARLWKPLLRRFTSQNTERLCPHQIDTQTHTHTHTHTHSLMHSSYFFRFML
jgi:hypothetical protein